MHWPFLWVLPGNIQYVIIMGTLQSFQLPIIGTLPRMGILASRAKNFQTWHIPRWLLVQLTPVRFKMEANIPSDQDVADAALAGAELGAVSPQEECYCAGNWIWMSLWRWYNGAELWGKTENAVDRRHEELGIDKFHEDLYFHGVTFELMDTIEDLREIKLTATMIEQNQRPQHLVSSWELAT